MQCPHCQHEHRPEAKFCDECGARLRAACPACGQEVAPTAKFCPECGTGLAGPRPSAAPLVQVAHRGRQRLTPAPSGRAHSG